MMASLFLPVFWATFDTALWWVLGAGEDFEFSTLFCEFFFFLTSSDKILFLAFYSVAFLPGIVLWASSWEGPQVLAGVA